MIDEFFERVIDWLCDSVPKATKPWKIRYRTTAFGWRWHLYSSAAKRKIFSMLSNIKNEDTANRAMEEAAERSSRQIQKIREFFKEQAVWVPRLEKWGRTIRFVSALLMMLMALLGVCMMTAQSRVYPAPRVLGSGRSGLAVTAAALCLLWLSAAMESGYEPVAGGVRQTYIASTLLRTGAASLMLISYLGSYVAQGVPSNVVLQSTMIIMLFIHAVLYLGLVLFNRRQPAVLRLLAGATGVMPALTAAAALALCASYLFRPWPLPAAGVMSAAGAMLAFLCDELITIKNLGGIRLKYYSIWVCLLLVGGYFLMLLGAWVNTPIM